MAEAFPSQSSSDKDVLTEWMDQLSEWSSIPLSIAVIGGSGSGKSSFINSIRGLKPNAKGAAKTGVVKTTTEVEAFTFSNNRNKTLVDLPGAGTPEWPKEDYIKRIGGISNYDFFLILSASRFTQIDWWLAKELKDAGKPFYFVRTKIDQDILNDSKTNENHSTKKVLDKLRAYCISEIEQICNSDEIRVYLISNFDTDEYDFPKLKNDIEDKFPAFDQNKLKMKRAGLIEMKKKYLAKRINDIADLSVRGLRFSFKRFAGKTDTDRIKTEIKLYQTQFGIDKCSLEQLETKIGKATIREIEKTLSQIESFKSDVEKLLEIYEQNENRISKVVLGLTVVGVPINLMKAYSEVRSILANALDYTASAADQICLAIQGHTERKVCVNRTAQVVI